MKNETHSSVVFRVPDFVDASGVVYSDIEIVVEMDHIRDAVKLGDALQRPLNASD